MTIIDAHAHIYPDAVALKAAASIGEFYDIPVCLDGTLRTLLAEGQKAGISRFLVHSVALTWRRVRAINDYLMETARAHPDTLIGFGTLHPEHPDVPGELRRMKAGGLRGVKLHPDFQRFHLDDPQAVALFREMAAQDMPLLTHVGDSRYDYSEPARMARAMDAVPGLKAICAHLGGWSVWEEGFKALAGRENLWVDTCSSLYALSPDRAAEIIRHYGADRALFGTDYPMWRPEEELARFRALPLTGVEQAMILGGNLEALLSSLT